MLKYKCLVLDHDDTVVQTERTIGYPYFRDFIERIRPGCTLSFTEYVQDCNNMVFAEMCRRRWHFTEEELMEEYLGWKAYSRTHIPPIFPGIDEVIRRQKKAGGLVCVASLSTSENITRDYTVHIGIQPDAIYDYDLPAEHRKPNPFALNDIMRQFSLKPEDILVLDDMKLGWTMAQAVGAHTAFAKWSKADIPEVCHEMQRICTYTFDSTTDLEKFLFE